MFYDLYRIPSRRKKQKLKKYEVVRMFQNIAKDFEDQSQDEDVEFHSKQNKFGQVWKRIFTKQNILLYILAFMLSMVGIQTNESMFLIAPFGMAILAAALSAGVPISIMYIGTCIGTTIRFGINGLLQYILTTLLFFVIVLIKRPIEQEESERKKVGIHLFLAVLLVQIAKMFLGTVLLYDVLASVMFAITVFIFYKIFVNSLIVIKDFGIKKAFSIEEVIRS